MPRAKTEADTPGWPKNTPPEVKAGALIYQMADNADMYRMTKTPRYVLWQQLTKDQKRFVIRYATNQGNISLSERDIGRSTNWYLSQLKRTKTGLAFGELCGDLAGLQEHIEEFVRAEIVRETLAQTVDELFSEDPKERRLARKEGWDFIKSSMKASVPPPQVEQTPPVTLFKPRDPTPEEIERYEAKGTPVTVESNTLERDDDP